MMNNLNIASSHTEQSVILHKYIDQQHVSLYLTYKINDAIPGRYKEMSSIFAEQ